MRTVDDNEYYELRCMDCGAKLAFGSMKKGGGLFPKRKDADGKLATRQWLDQVNSQKGYSRIEIQIII